MTSAELTALTAVTLVAWLLEERRAANERSWEKAVQRNRR